SGNQTWLPEALQQQNGVHSQRSQPPSAHSRRASAAHSPTVSSGAPQSPLQTRAPSRAAATRPGSALGVALLVEGGQTLEVATDARGELLRLRAHDSQVALAPGPLAPLSCLEPEPVAEPGPLGAGEDDDGAGEQCDEHPAHSVHSSERVPAASPAVPSNRRSRPVALLPIARA